MSETGSMARTAPAAPATEEVDYDHRSFRAAHTVKGALAALRLMIGSDPPGSLLDVGCGWGTWLRAALKLGVTDIAGIDGAAIPPEDFLCDHKVFRQQDLRAPWDLGRRFDLALCLEVAEHLPAEAAPILIASLVRHSDAIFFSAAAPRQPGHHHINCQWPVYWQELFSRHGYRCDDKVRWKIWEEAEIEPWYRQNMFLATRSADAAVTGERIRPVVHPEMLEAGLGAERNVYRSEIESGILPIAWYLSLPYRAGTAKLRRKLRRALARSRRGAGEPQAP